MLGNQVKSREVKLVDKNVVAIIHQGYVEWGILMNDWLETPALTQTGTRPIAQGVVRIMTLASDSLIGLKRFLKDGGSVLPIHDMDVARIMGLQRMDGNGQQGAMPPPVIEEYDSLSHKAKKGRPAENGRPFLLVHTTINDGSKNRFSLPPVFSPTKLRAVP